MAQADSLDDQKNATQTAIDNNKEVLTKAEQKAKEAQDALAASQQKLDSAKADLAAKQKETQDAKDIDTSLAADLAIAQKTLSSRNADLATANAAVTQGEADLAAQRDNIGLVVQTTAQQNTALLSLSILFTDFNSAQLSNRLQWASSAFNASQNAMDQLKAAQTMLETAQANAKLAAQAAKVAKAVAQTKSDAAAAHLAVTQQAENASQKAKTAVEDQVAANQKAQDDADKAVEAAKAEDKKLAADMAKILALIKAELKKQKEQDKKKSGSTPNKPAPSTGTFFYRPVPGPVTSPFGWRMHPILHYWKFHEGVDFGNSCGTPIHAAASGKVTYAGWNGGYGNYTLINHGKINGSYWSTGYGHQSRIIVRYGQHVTRGQVIGYVGTTGLSTGCHLHFNVSKNGKFINGLPLV